MTFGWYQLKLLGALLGIFVFKSLFWRQSSNLTGRFIQVINSNILLKEKWVHKGNEHCFPQKKKCGWLTVNWYNELLFNNYYNLLTMFSIFWSITSLLAFDIWRPKNFSHFLSFQKKRKCIIHTLLL
jgi:hypothetical protein